MPPHSTSHSSHSSFSSHSSSSHSSFSSHSHSSSFSGGSIVRSSYGRPSQPIGHSGSRPGSSYNYNRPMMPPPPPASRVWHSRPPVVRVMPVIVNSTTNNSRRQQQADIMRPRARTNQPNGYTESIPNYQPSSFYHCKKHDYMFYPVGWYDSMTGNFRGAGYYDENGEYYPNAAIMTPNGYEAAAFCTTCNKMVQPMKKHTDRWRCPFCKNPVEDMLEDEEITKAPQKKKSHTGWIILAAIIAFGIIGSSQKNIDTNRQYQTGTYGQQQTYTLRSNIDMFGNPIYVEALGRECKWMPDYNSYYDRASDCYFWFNTDVSTPQWQYWYEGISSDYSKSGWMEYDFAKEEWKIEKSEGNWITLPAKYDTSNLWHMPEGFGR